MVLSLAYGQSEIQDIQDPDQERPPPDHRGQRGRRRVPQGREGVLDSLTEIGHKELKKNGIFVLPGFAKFVVVKKPARPARQGINPFTKEPTTFAAKPASKAVKARPAKAIKDVVA
jgi:nucleoid DNA-binding protein